MSGDKGMGWRVSGDEGNGLVNIDYIAKESLRGVSDEGMD